MEKFKTDFDVFIFLSENSKIYLFSNILQKLSVSCYRSLNFVDIIPLKLVLIRAYRFVTVSAQFPKRVCTQCADWASLFVLKYKGDTSF